MPKKRRHGASRNLPVRVAQREDGLLALQVGGVTQSVSVPASDAAEAAPSASAGYWELMLPPECPASALLLGLGGGTAATLLARRCPGVRMIGVERDAEVLALAREAFGLDTLAGLEVVEADAFAWVAAQFSDDSALQPNAARFDLICLDLFEAGRLVKGALATPFLRQIAALVAPGGAVACNLMVTGRTPEQLHRLRRVFRIERELRLRGNLVVHLTPLPQESLALAPGAGVTADAPPTPPPPPR